MADEKYWTYHGATKTPDVSDLPKGVFNGTQAQWESLSPGMRREIARTAAKLAVKKGEGEQKAKGGLAHKRSDKPARKARAGACR